MSDFAGPPDGPPEGRLLSASETAEIRAYILEMIEQLARMAAVHGQHDLVSRLVAACGVTEPTIDTSTLN